MPSVLERLAHHAARLTASRTNDHELGDTYRTLPLDDAALDILLRVLPCVALDEMHALHYGRPRLGQHLQCKALREEGYRVILVNSNPATIMTDPDTADAVYIEPVNWQTVAKIIEKEQPNALLPTMGGQTGLNCALDLVREPDCC